MTSQENSEMGSKRQLLSMYEISNEIKSLPFKELQLKPLVNTSLLQILCVSLEQDAIFPEHSSPRDAQLIVLEGEITFYINEKQFELLKHQHFNFPKEVVHWVKANANSKFLIIR